MIFFAENASELSTSLVIEFFWSSIKCWGTGKAAVFYGLTTVTGFGLLAFATGPGLAELGTVWAASGARFLIGGDEIRTDRNRSVVVLVDGDSNDGRRDSKQWSPSACAVGRACRPPT